MPSPLLNEQVDKMHLNGHPPRLLCACSHMTASIIIYLYRMFSCCIGFHIYELGHATHAPHQSFQSRTLSRAQQPTISVKNTVAFFISFWAMDAATNVSNMATDLQDTALLDGHPVKYLRRRGLVQNGLGLSGWSWDDCTKSMDTSQDLFQ